MSHVLVIDQGTTSTRSIVFDAAARPVAVAQQEFPQSFPRPGWVEHDPEDLWRTALDTAREAMASAGLRAADVAEVDAPLGVVLRGRHVVVAAVDVEDLLGRVGRGHGAHGV